MRRLPILATTAFLVIWAPLAEAQQLAQATSGAARAGTAAAVRGEVMLASVPGVREVGKNVTSGDPIFHGDQVTTGAEGRLQIMLADETVFTIGPNAAMVIDNFVYDPNTNAGKVTASVLKGTFRFVTGKVAKREPSDMEVKLPVDSIGVRGTSVAGETDGTRATVVLLGPGPDTNTGERVGRILVTGTGATGAATTVEIIRPGFGTEISGANVPPSAAMRIDPGRIAAMTAPLAGTAPRPAAQPTTPNQSGGQQSQQQAQPQQPGPAQPQTQAQGQTPAAAGPQVAGQAIAGGPSLLTQSGAHAAGGLGNIRTVGALAPASQQAARIASVPQAPVSVPDGATTFEQLRSINNGTVVFSVTNQPLTLVQGTGSGTFSYTGTLNFGTRDFSATLTLLNYQLGAVGAQDFTDNSTGEGYSNKTGVVANNTSPVSRTNTAGGARDRIEYSEKPFNLAGKIAKQLEIKVEVFANNTGSPPAAGSGCTNAANCMRATVTAQRP